VRKAGRELVEEADVKVDELKEEIKSMDEIFKQMNVYTI
jgi:hypothetical protein